MDFYDAFDGWTGSSYGMFDDLDLAIIDCDELMETLDTSNKSMGEHYGVIDGVTGREVYCGKAHNYKNK